MSVLIYSFIRKSPPFKINTLWLVFNLLPLVVNGSSLTQTSLLNMTFLGLSHRFQVLWRKEVLKCLKRILLLFEIVNHVKQFRIITIRRRRGNRPFILNLLSIITFHFNNRCHFFMYSMELLLFVRRRLTGTLLRTIIFSGFSKIVRGVAVVTNFWLIALCIVHVSSYTLVPLVIFYKIWMEIRR